MVYVDDLLEYFVFLLPVATLLARLWFRSVKAEQSAKSDFEDINKKGMRPHILGKFKSSIPPTACFLVAPAYIEYGWFWTALGVLTLLGPAFFLLLSPTAKLSVFTAPAYGSMEFERAISRRKKGAVASVIVLLLWVASWNHLFT